MCRLNSTSAYCTASTKTNKTQNTTNMQNTETNLADREFCKFLKLRGTTTTTTTITTTMIIITIIIISRSYRKQLWWHCTHALVRTNVKVQNACRGKYAINCNHRIAATLYTLETCLFKVYKVYN
jgi:hypothetical protein